MAVIFERSHSTYSEIPASTEYIIEDDMQANNTSGNAQEILESVV